MKFHVVDAEHGLHGGRAPQGARGLKSKKLNGKRRQKYCRAPQGARGLKFFAGFQQLVHGRRAPQGARGLKSKNTAYPLNTSVSRPARGAWVEIKDHPEMDLSGYVAPRKGRVG